MKKFTKTLSLLLAVLVLLSAFAVSAAALDEVSEVAVSGITPPVAGQTPDFIKASSADRMLYTVSNYGLYMCGYYWYHDDDTPVAEDETFEEGETYYVEIKLDAADEHSFTSPLTATVNGEPANGNILVANKGKNAYVYHSFTCSAAESKVIANVAITGVVEPAAGDSPSYDFEVDEHVEIDDIRWYQDGDELGADATFEDGVEYELALILSLEPGYTFAIDDAMGSTVTVEIPGSNQTVNGYEGNPENRIIVRTHFTAEAEDDPSVIDAVTVSGLTEPEPGAAPSDVAEVHGALLDSIKWYNVTDKRDMQPGEVFEDGKTYRASIIVSAPEGSDFSVDEEGNTEVTATVGGEDAEVYNLDEVNAKRSVEIIVYYGDDVEDTEETTAPETTAPETTDPAETTAPETTEPEATTAPTTTEPAETTAPATSAPSTDEPETTAPVTTAPATTAPATTAPETTAPATTAPVTTAPATTAPATTAPVTTAPATTAPATTAPATTAPATTEPTTAKPETPISPGASIDDAEKAIKTSKTDEPKGTTFGLLCARAVKVGKNSITIGWNKLSGAKKYIVYANACGIENQFKKLKTLPASKNKLKVTKMFGKKLKKGTYYKFLVIAVDKKKKVLSTSKTLHIATKGGKRGNFKSVTTAAKNNKVTLAKKGSKFKLNAKAVAESKKRPVSVHRKIKYEVDNKKIAVVSSKGVIKAKKKGTCYVYVYAQSGAYKKIKVKVG